MQFQLWFLRSLRITEDEGGRVDMIQSSVHSTLGTQGKRERKKHTCEDDTNAGGKCKLCHVMDHDNSQIGAIPSSFSQSVL